MSINAQIEKLNDYKYVIIPEKFDFVNESDKYQTSSLTKFLLKRGIKVYKKKNKNFKNFYLSYFINKNFKLPLIAAKIA